MDKKETHSARVAGPRPIPGLTREAEEAALSEIIDVAQTNLDKARESIRQMGQDVEELFESAEQEDKSTLILWNDTKIRLQDLKRNISRFEKARKKPYFGRIDFQDPAVKYPESYYIGRMGISRGTDEPLVIDWRAPIASVYYENTLGPCRYTVSSEGTFEIDLERKRTYEIEKDRLKDFFDSDVVANDDLLTKFLAKNKKAVLGEIIATIQAEQNLIIRRSPKTNIIVQGCAGSGKTTVAMHRISYILYNYEEEFRPEDFYIIGSNQILLNYITSVLPDLDVYGVSQMTMEQLFTRLLYEDWDPSKYSIRPVDKSAAASGDAVRGSMGWFRELEDFCKRYEKKVIPEQEIYLENTEVLLAGANLIRTYCEENPQLSVQSKRLMLNEILLSKFENEVQGKGITFTAPILKELTKTYSTWFGKDVWKGSVYELYQDFLAEQTEKGYSITIPDTEFDVYDLAALAYLYKRIKETDPIREASHVVIDEAQDFGMMAYASLHYCLRGCTYTIMGDTSQNIHFDYGLNDWEELRKLILTGTYDAFGLLKKSYRNTVEISDFATEILRHGDFSIYPVEPIIRHGNPVRSCLCKDVRELLAETVKTVRGWQEQGYETIAIVCRDEKETRKVSAELSRYLKVTDGTAPNAEFGNGIMVLPVSYTKGLEFDAVLLFNPSEKGYPAEDGYVKLLYVAATRALHELTVVYRGHLTPLIGEAVSPEKHMRELTAETLTKAHEYGKKEYTEKELMQMERRQGAKEMHEREVYGPERVTIKPDAQKTVRRDWMGNSASRVIGTAKPASSGTITSVAAPAGQSPLSSVSALKRDARRKAEAEKPATAIGSKNGPINSSPFKFGDIVSDAGLLRPKGHSRISSAIRWVKKTKTYVDLASSYGILRLTPIAPEIIRVTFARGSLGEIRENYWNLKPQGAFKWSCRESSQLFELTTEKLTIRIEKKNGAVIFRKPDGTVLLSEKAAEPRQVEDRQVWNYFAWEKNEKLKAKGILNTDLMDMSKKARYISHGGKGMRMPLLVSDKGYALGIPSTSTVLCCTIPMYGPYISAMDTDQADYYFFYGGSSGKSIELYANHVQS